MVSLTTISHLFLFRYHNYLLDLFRPNLEGATSQRCIIYPEKYRSKLLKKYISHTFLLTLSIIPKTWNINTIKANDKNTPELKEAVCLKSFSEMSNDSRSTGRDGVKTTTSWLSRLRLDSMKNWNFSYSYKRTARISSLCSLLYNIDPHCQVKDCQLFSVPLRGSVS